MSPPAGQEDAVDAGAGDAGKQDDQAEQNEAAGCAAALHEGAGVAVGGLFGEGSLQCGCGRWRLRWSGA